LEAQGNYVRIHAGRASHRLRTSIGALERQLDLRHFRRINRSQIVALDRVRELQPWFHGDGLVILTSGAKLRLSRRYRDRVNGDGG
jgi:two-component system LytT family response regulator